MIMFLTPKIPRNLQWVVDLVEEKKTKKHVLYFYGDPHGQKY
jgi:hypothetical protein